MEFFYFKDLAPLVLGLESLEVRLAAVFRDVGLLAELFFARIFRLWRVAADEDGVEFVPRVVAVHSPAHELAGLVALPPRQRLSLGSVRRQLLHVRFYYYKGNFNPSFIFRAKRKEERRSIKWTANDRTSLMIVELNLQRKSG